MAISVLPSPPIKRRVLPASLPNHVTEKEAKSGSDSTSMNQLSFVEKLSRKGLEENILKVSSMSFISCHLFRPVNLWFWILFESPFRESDESYGPFPRIMHISK